MVNKTWDKTKAVMSVGWCNVCKKELLSDDGGWIVTAAKKHFCHDGKDGSCFDNYCEEQKLKAEDATYEKEI
jgi:hypothetical protein